MDGYDVHTVAIKGARDVQRFALDVRHEQDFWIRLVFGMLFYDIAGRHHKLKVGVSNLPQPHALLGVPADEIPVLSHGLAEGGDVNPRHSKWEPFAIVASARPARLSYNQSSVPRSLHHP
jgi:hypothetical protein